MVTGKEPAQPSSQGAERMDYQAEPDERVTAAYVLAQEPGQTPSIHLILRCPLGGVTPPNVSHDHFRRIGDGYPRTQGAIGVLAVLGCGQRRVFVKRTDTIDNLPRSSHVAARH